MPISGAPGPSSDANGGTSTGDGNEEPRKLGGRPSKRAIAEGKLTEGNFRRIARATNLTPQHVGRVIKGAAETKLSTAYRIAVAAGVTLDELYEYAQKRNAASEAVATGKPVKRKKAKVVKRSR
jgi:hypothetical protein